MKQKTYVNFIDIAKQCKTGYTKDTSFADPFVLRYLGKYYLYCTFSDIVVYVSDDLINWTYAGIAMKTDKTLEEFRSCYAPEVVYYNGQFILCTSPSGTGHRFYRADSPLGPFTPLTDKILKGIDGSFFIDDNNKLLFMHTVSTSDGGDGLCYNDLSSLEIPDYGDENKITDAFLNGWTEGPGVFERTGYYYLTYTGNHFLSKGYRICYSYQKAKDFNLSSFTQPFHNTVMISTDDDYTGIGHNSSFVAPDLDGVYTAYHTLYGKRGPDRRYNLTRYFTNGAILTANGLCNYSVLTPKKADYEYQKTSGLTITDNKLLTPNALGMYTAELNFKGGKDGATVYCRYDDPSRYTTLKIGVDTAVLTKHVGEEVETFTANLNQTITPNCLHTIRIENGFAKARIFYNGRKLFDLASLGRGSVGYGDGTTPLYTAVSKDVFGTSDFDAVKNLPSIFPATTYKKDEKVGFYIKSAYAMADGIRQGEKENTIRHNNFDSVLLSDKDDYISYDINAGFTGQYYVSAYVSKKCEGSVIRLIIDRKKYKITIPKISGADDFAYIHLCKVNIKKGFRKLTIKLISGSLDIAMLGFNYVTPIQLKGKVDLRTAEELHGRIGICDGYLFSDGKVGCGLFGNDALHDFDLTMTVLSPLKENLGGIVFRAKNYSYFDNQVAESMYAYQLSFDQEGVHLDKLNYGMKNLVSAKANIKPNEPFILQIKTDNNHIVVQINGTKCIDYFDDNAYLYGRFGLLAKSPELKIKDIEIKQQ